ncbi:RNA polymerase sigma factor [Pseudenhygromyxa sp. WMMC2535]|uniref:RNA polymerase sigma factor n=1 Tax=Pseudenhygromyxa sp. WMMC2535 TaxID=2712867 RepID=UPI001595A09E|nr:RNA polymerase sigma factor [Pseudenhygromyxa sp. WMMC2535]NVB38861.1 RNA polymerase sigma factor [Pseudenhygromyxa sp. WMMC2535]
MQCQTVSEVGPGQSSMEGVVCDAGMGSWSRRISSIFRTATGDDTAGGMWETGNPGDNMSSRPIPAVPAPEPESSTASEVESVSDLQSSELAEALRAGDPTAIARLFDLYGAHVERVLIRTIGRDTEMDDMVQDVFLGAYRSGHNFQGNDEQLKAWISRIAVFTARGYLRKRKRRWWLRSAAPDQMPELTSKEASPHIQEVLRRTYAALDQMDPDLRIPLALRELEKLELAEIAEACECSVSTIKRRLARARKAFERLAKNDPILRDWVEESN